MTVPPARIRIHSFVSPTHFLHVEDATAIDKVRLFAGSYRPGSGATIMLHHFVDLADVRVFCYALIARVLDYAYVEYKGTVHDHTHATSRVLRLHTRKDKVWLELTSGPGTLTRTGAIAPNLKARNRRLTVNVALSWHEAQALAHAILAFLQAWEVLRAFRHEHQLGLLLDYTVYCPAQTEAEVTTFADDDLPPDVTSPTTLIHPRYGDSGSVRSETPTA